MQVGNRLSIWVAGFVVLIAGGGAASSKSLQPQRIDEAQYISIGGIDQWITIRGDDNRKPLLLLVHGGPGDVQSPFVQAYAPYEHDYVLVQWDQRGGGRTFVKYGKETPNVTLAQQIEDGIEIAEYLHQRFPKHHLIVLGHSWGTIVSTGMIQKRPDLFYTYVGTGQMASWSAVVAHKYDVALRAATKAQDSKAITTLESIGKPNPADVPQFFAISRLASGGLPADDAQWFAATPKNLSEAPGYTDKEVKAYSDGINFSVTTLLSTLIQVDLTRTAPTVRVPYCVIQGTDDINVSPQAAKSYFESINAPKKRFYALEGAGHFALATHQVVFLEKLKNCLAR